MQIEHALSAPRPLFIWYATEDTIFPNTDNIGGLIEETRSVFALYEADAAIEDHAFDGPHKFPHNARDQAYRWLEKSLTDDE